MIRFQERIKPDYSVIEEWVSDKASVLDLGCGDGTLLASLAKDKGTRGVGIEIDPEGLNQCLRKGLSVIEQDIDRGLASFQNGSFDFVVLNMTLQAIRHPLLVIQEMVRVGRRAIVGFPNFGYWKILLQLLASERMPKTKTLPHEWHNTPNIRMITLKDFKCLCADNRIRILKEIYLNEAGRLIGPSGANWRAAEGIFLLEKN